MGEANRRKALEYGITKQIFPKDSAEALVGSVLQNIADILDCAIFLKEAGDDLLDWPNNSIIGQTTKITNVQECPLVKDIREKPFQRIWEFLITDALLQGCYAVDAMARGLQFPGPINPPESIKNHVRKWFQTAPPTPGAWKGVIPTSTALATMPPKGMQPN
jgi:hypothetical protein